MYKELFLIVIGIILGMIAMYYILRPQIGDKYQIEADIKNKKGQMVDNIFKGVIAAKTPKKEGLFKRIKNKRLTKKEKRNV